MSRKNTRRRTLGEWKAERKASKEKALREELEQIRERLKHYERCETLQQRVKRFCELTGTKYEQFGSWLRFETENGVKITVYRNPLRYMHSPDEIIFGHVEDPNRRYLKLRYLLESTALHMYNRLDEKIKELENRNDK